MKLSIESQHRDFLRDNFYIEFEALMTPAHVQELREATADSCAKQATRATLDLRRFSALELFRCGRDHWRQSDSVRRWATRKQFAEVFADLVMRPKIRLACTQVIGGCKEPGLAGSGQALPGETLADICSIQGLLGAVILCLEPFEDEAPEGDTCLLPQQVGNAVFVLPEAVIGLQSVNQRRGGRFLVIAYGDNRCVYVRRESDPLTHWLKALGYVYGDRLNDRLNPMLIR